MTAPEASGAGGAVVTKYRITKPFNEKTTWDDFMIALPERDHLAKTSKEVPVFLRYLKLVCDKEGRTNDWKEFMARCKSGLQVENDAFITVDELLTVMWKNGFSEQSRNAVQFTFGSDYKFHYPELAVLFDLSEEDTYKFCLRTRMEQSHIGELDYGTVVRKGFLRDHWIVFGTGVFLLGHFPFFNYVFFLKIFGTGVWTYSVWSLANRYLGNVIRRNEYMALQKTAHDVKAGEDAIIESMQRFANDARALTCLKEFKKETQEKLTTYRSALVLEQQRELSDRVGRQLQSIAQFENTVAASLQALLVQEAASKYRDAIKSDKKAQDTAFDFAVSSLAGKAPSVDPLTSHFAEALKSLEKVDIASAKPDPNGSIVERVAAAYQKKEADFKASFMVSATEAAEVKQLAAKAKGNFASLDEASLGRLEELYSTINNRMGFYATHEKELTKVAETGDAAGDSYVKYVNEQLALTQAKIKEKRLTAFTSAFA